jgi:hypothetical protein
VTGIEPASRAWKARPVPSSWPDATPMAQVRRTCVGPLLTVRDRQMPVLRARGGHGRRGRSGLGRGGDGHTLNRRVRPVHDDHLPRWQGRQARGSWTEGVRTRRQTPTASPVDAVRVVTWRLGTSRRGCSRKAFSSFAGDASGGGVGDGEPKPRRVGGVVYD